MMELSFLFRKKILARFLHKKYQDHVSFSFSYKDACIDDRFTKPIVVFRGKNAGYEFIIAILKEYEYCKKVMKKHFDKNLIMSEEDEHLFQQSSSCWSVKNLLTMTMKRLEIIVP